MDNALTKRDETMLHLVFAAAIGLGSSWCAGAADTGSLAGTVRTSAGEPVRAAVTIHDLTTPRTTGRTPFDRQFASKSDGAFLIESVPPGKYEICVDGPQKAVLDPCVWSPPAPSVTVTEGGSVTGLALTVETGALLRVRVNDREGLLPRIGGSAVHDALSLGVVTRRNRYLNLRMSSSDPAGQDHFIVVPFEEAVTLAVGSSVHALSDENFVPFAGNSKRISIKVAQGTTPAPIVVNVAKR